jgi:hypothetical protein
MNRWRHAVQNRPHQHPGEGIVTTYLEYAEKMSHRIGLLLGDAGMEGMPMRYEDYLGLDQFMRKLIATSIPLVLSDNYEHFMAKLPGKPYGAQQVIIRRQIGGFNVAILVRVIATFQGVDLLVQAMITCWRLSP